MTGASWVAMSVAFRRPSNEGMTHEWSDVTFARCWELSGNGAQGMWLAHSARKLRATSCLIGITRAGVPFLLARSPRAKRQKRKPRSGVALLIPTSRWRVPNRRHKNLDDSARPVRYRRAGVQGQRRVARRCT
jgi:hypothetical protein